MEILKYHSKKGNNTVLTVIFMLDHLVDALYESKKWVYAVLEEIWEIV